MISTPSGSSRSCSALTTSPPKPSSRSQALPTPATRMLRSRSPLIVDHLHLVGKEEQEPSTLAQQLLARVVVNRQRQMGSAVVVGEDALDGRRPALEHPGMHVGLVPRADDHASAAAEPDLVHHRL